MEFILLNAAISAEKNLWSSILMDLPIERQDVYFQPEYLQANIDSSETEALCVVCKSGAAVLVYPFLRSIIERKKVVFNQTKLRDIRTAYGYGGPVVNFAGEDHQFLEVAWSLFAKWCKTEHVITEFVRFHPLLDNVRWASSLMKSFNDRTTIPMQLDSYEIALGTSSYYRSHRQMLNKANRMGFTFHVLPASSELSWFVPLYLSTQESLSASSETKFEMDYFNKLTYGLGSNAWLGVIKQNNEIAAAALVLESRCYLHSHLMGYRQDIKTAGMTNLLYHGIAKIGAGNEKQVLHMGGGLTGSDKDSLFRFKQSLSPARASFWLGTCCHNQIQYEEVGKEWERENGPRPKNYFQFYRLPRAV